MVKRNRIILNPLSRVSDVYFERVVRSVFDSLVTNGITSKCISTQKLTSIAVFGYSYTEVDGNLLTHVQPYESSFDGCMDGLKVGSKVFAYTPLSNTLEWLRAKKVAEDLWLVTYFSYEDRQIERDRFPHIEGIHECVARVLRVPCDEQFKERFRKFADMFDY